MSARRKTYRFFTSTPSTETVFGDDLYESDIWGYAPADHRMSIHPPSGLGRKNSKNTGRVGGSTVGSLPLKIPEWSKGAAGRQFFEDDGGDDVGGEVMGAVIPPHELLWRNRAESFSMQEGIGRTLKGRDLSRVRDSIWLRTGFED